MSHVKPKRLIPHPVIVQTSPEEPCARLCKTCAYRTPPTEDEIAYERSMFVERGHQPHVCHSDPARFCRGSFEFTKSLGLHRN